MKRSLGSALVAVVLAMLSVTSWAAEKAGEACVQASPTDMVVASVGQLGSEEVLLCTGGVWVSHGRVGTDLVALNVLVLRDGEPVTVGSMQTLDGMPAPMQVGKQTSYVERVTKTVTKDGVQTEVVPTSLVTGTSLMALPTIQRGGRIEVDIAVTLSKLIAMKTITLGDVAIQSPDTEVHNARQKVVFESGEEKTVFAAGGYTIKIRATIVRADSRQQG